MEKNVFYISYKICLLIKTKLKIKMQWYLFEPSLQNMNTMQWHLFKQLQICSLCIEMKVGFWHLLLKLINVGVLIRCEGVGKNQKMNKRSPSYIKHPRVHKVLFGNVNFQLSLRLLIFQQLSKDKVEKVISNGTIICIIAYSLKEKADIGWLTDDQRNSKDKSLNLLIYNIKNISHLKPLLLNFFTKLGVNNIPISTETVLVNAFTWYGWLDQTIGEED